MRRDWDETSSWDLRRLREDLDRRPYPRKAIRKVEVRDDEVGGVRARWFVPPSAPTDRAVLYFHGGSYIYGSAKTTHAEFIAQVALESGLRVVGIDYRLAPEHRYPKQLEDAFAAFAALSPRYQLVVAGDSAGGNLALELQLLLRDRALPQAAALALISPWSDLEMPGESFVENSPYDFGTRAELERHARAFAGEMSLGDPRLSPVHADVAGLNPVFVCVSEAEIPRDDILALAAHLERSGVVVTRHLAIDMPHFAPLFAAFHPNGARAQKALADYLRQALAGPSRLGVELTQ